MSRSPARTWAPFRELRAGRQGRPDPSWRIRALKLAVLVWTLAFALGGCSGRSGDGGSSSPSFPTADYQSAPPPRPPEGGDDEGYNPLSVDDTGIAAIDGSRLYYLSSDRGLVIIDVTQVDQPRILGGSSLSGNPQAVYVDGSLVVVVFGGWFTTTPQGQPFQGSVVRVLDATDPTHVALVGEVPIHGYVQESRLVGDILYTAGTDRGASYGWQYSSASPSAVITSVGWSTGTPLKIAEQTIPGDDGTFAFATTALVASTVSASSATSTSTLQYVDISDPAGAITLRGSLTVSGAVGLYSGFCSNTGGWSLDFADGVHAHAVATGGGNGATPVVELATGDFTNPDAPLLISVLQGLGAPGDEQGLVPRFDVDPSTGRALLYVGHSGSQDAQATPLDIYDLSNEASPQLASAVSFPGDICSLQPNGTQLLTTSSFLVDNNGGLAIEQFDVTDPAAPKTPGAAPLQTVRDIFPAAEATWETTIDPTGSVALVPVTFNPASGPYTSGLEVLSLGSANLGPVGTATVQDPILRGIFVQGRAYAFTEETLTVFDVSNPASPQATAHLTFAPYVYAVQPVGSVVAELTLDFNEGTTTDVRLVAPSAVNDVAAWAAATPVTVPGLDPESFVNGSLLYVSTTACGEAQCTTRGQQITVVDVSSGTPVARGSVELPPIPTTDPYGPYTIGYDGWYTGPDVVQVAPSTLAIRRPAEPLHVVDLSNPDAPTMASVAILGSGTPWWGNMRLLGGTLYVTAFDLPAAACTSPGATSDCLVSYYLVPVDLNDPANPTVGAAVSVPGILFGTSAEDPSTLYLSNYVWGTGQEGAQEQEEITVCELSGGHCSLEGTLPLDGDIGAPFLQNDRAYATLVPYDSFDWTGGALHQIDLTDPQSPADAVVQTGSRTWGSLLAVSGDAALVTSGWSGGGADVYRLNGTAAPTFVETVCSVSWNQGTFVPQGGTLYLAMGDCGAQPVAVP